MCRLSRFLFIAALAVFSALAAPGSFAQPYGTDLIVSDRFGRLFRVTQGGNVTTIGTYLPGAIPWDLTTDVDDRKVIASMGTWTLTTGGLLSIDLATGAANTLVLGVPSRQTKLDENGDFVVSNYSGVQRVSRSTQAVTTIYSETYPFGVGLADRYVDSGNWVIHGINNLYHYDPSSGTVVSAFGTSSAGMSVEFCLDPSGADAYTMFFALSRMDVRTGQAPVLVVNGLTPPFNTNAIAIDRAPDRGGELIYFYWDERQALCRCDRNGGALSTIAVFPDKITGITFDRGPNLAATLVAPPNDRTLFVSFANAAGKPYAVLFGLSGVQPGVTLPDGRHLALNPDALTALTAQGAIPPLLLNNRGVLDATGRQQVQLSLNALGAAVKGVRLWAVAAVLDPAASLGVAQISAPTVIVL